MHKEWIEHFIGETEARWTAASDFIWDHPETRFVEFQSAAFLIKLLEDEAFKITRHVAGIETAFIAEYRLGDGPVIAFLGEYDALPALSQVAFGFEAQPLEENGNGHGCGHHLLGVASLAAAVALKHYIVEQNIEATIRFYGCPAEEGGSGKTFMVRDGAFDDVDVALTWHPASMTAVWNFSTLSNIQARFAFEGISAHAASSPHLGRSALDAVELMNVGVNYLREHMIDGARVHYAVTDTGGHSPNVVQRTASVIQLIRAPVISQANALFSRVKKIAEGASLMTETDVEVHFEKAASNYIPNHTLGELMGRVIHELGAPVFSDEEMSLAKQFQNTLSNEELHAANIGMEALNFALQKPLSDIAIPYFETDHVLAGSTDVGDVSWVVPTAQCVSSCFAVGTSYHSWQLVAQGKSSFAHKGMLHASKILALTAMAVLRDPSLLKKAHAELEGLVYENPIPREVKPGADTCGGCLE